MPVAAVGIAAQGGYAAHGTCLGKYVVVGRGAVETLFQGTVHTSYRQRRYKMGTDVLLPPGIYKQGIEHLGGDVVVERKTAAVGYLVTAILRYTSTLEYRFYI
mgnify:CR=1 FL=1